MNTENIFATRLKQLRLSKGLSQPALGKIIGVKAQAINDMEHGRIKTTLDRATILADYFDVPVNYLFGRGVFEHWDEIPQHKDEIIEQINQALTESIQIVDVSHMPDGFFMGLLDCLLDKVEFHEDRVKLFYKADISTDRTVKPEVNK